MTRAGPYSLAPIVHALGGELWAGGRRANVPGPGHSAADRSVSLLLEGSRVVVHCFAGDDWRDVLAQLRALGLVDDQAYLVGSAGASGAIQARPPDKARTDVARRLWGESRAVSGTLSARHLRLRGVDDAPTDALRHHPGAPASLYADAGPRRPALLAAIQDPTGSLVGVEVTYLAPNGRRARVRTPRKTIGSCPAGAAVRLNPPGPRLLVGEGVFTCLSAAAWFGLPAWALLSTGNLRAWRAPPGVQSVLIAADRGADGERSARILAAALESDGIDVAIQWPPEPWGDWNEAAAACNAGRRRREDLRDAPGAGVPARLEVP